MFTIFENIYTNHHLCDHRAEQVSYLSLGSMTAGQVSALLISSGSWTRTAASFLHVCVGSHRVRVRC